MLQFKNCSIGYQTQLFEIEHIELKRGKFISLLGKNGSGKSTFFSTLLGLHKPLRGELFFEKEKIVYSDSSYKHFALVDTHFQGVRFLKVIDYISLGRTRFSTFLHQLGKEDEHIIHQKISLFPVQHLLEKDTTKISDGERQMASIVKALVQEAKVILLDEPTSFLDYSNKTLLMKRLKEIAVTENLLIIQANHDVELCMQFSDELIWINEKEKKLVHETTFLDNKNHIIEQVFG